MTVLLSFGAVCGALLALLLSPLLALMAATISLVVFVAFGIGKYQGENNG